MLDIKKGNNKFYIGDNEEKPQAEITYVNDNSITIERTYVSSDLAGQGIGKILIQKIVDFARSENKKIIPKCPYAKNELSKNNDYEDILLK